MTAELNFEPERDSTELFNELPTNTTIDIDQSLIAETEERLPLEGTPRSTEEGSEINLTDPFAKTNEALAEFESLDFSDPYNLDSTVRDILRESNPNLPVVRSEETAEEEEQEEHEGQEEEGEEEYGDAAPESQTENPPAPTAPQIFDTNNVSAALNAARTQNLPIVAVVTSDGNLDAATTAS
ncbi:MAG: hypothetical protein K2Z81_11185, partial [Cyanobacteria bacterium]|nr:hypothetical protein [Cyanobacteriota bacterium]